MEFDYFYGPEDAEQYQFYRIPKLLITSERFKDVSVESKLLYGLMLDRLSLSIKNGWFDSLNRAYIIYTIEDVMEDIIGNGEQYYSFKENSVMPIGTQMFARDPAEIKFENVAESVVSEKRGPYSQWIQGFYYI